MEITTLRKQDIPAAAALFTSGFKNLRQAIPLLPDRMEDTVIVSGLLENLLSKSAGVAAFDGERLVGYLGWWLVDGFRNTRRRAGYVPEWAHAVVEEKKPEIYRGLYRAASDFWSKAGCNTHAITILASDKVAIDTWFWNGFGLTVLDAVRSITPVNPTNPDPAFIRSGYTVRKASLADAEALAELEGEHVQHYAQSPVLMIPFKPNNAEEYSRFLAHPTNHAWLVFKGTQPVAYLRFESQSEGAAEVVNGPGKIAITSAYVRPAHRGHAIALALLDEGLTYFSAQGFKRCSVDFESFNPEAVSFWLKYFMPVCFSVVRVPEK